jgi:hypoxanthine phosphoribosyltransferase
MTIRHDSSDGETCMGPHRLLLPSDRIAERVAQLADEIAACYADGDLTIVGVLTGAIVFLADLIRRLPVSFRLDMTWVRSYPGTATTSQGVQVLLPTGTDLTERDVLIVDDILDSGRTLSALIDRARSAGARSVRTCVLLRKDRPDLPDRLAPDFAGFDVPDEFVVGFGLDWDGRYRNLPDICVLESPPAGGPE